MCAYRKAILTIGMQLHAMPLHTTFGPFRFHLCNKLEAFLNDLSVVIQ